MRANKKTIQPQDVLEAVKELEFDAFLPRLEAELQSESLKDSCFIQWVYLSRLLFGLMNLRPQGYSTLQCDKRNTYRRKVRQEKSGATASSGNAAAGAEGSTPAHRAEKDSPPAAKKQRRSSVDGDEASDDEDGSPTPLSPNQGDSGAVNEDEEQDQVAEQDEDDEDDEDEDEQDEDEQKEDALMEDPLEEKSSDEDDQDEALDGNESD